MRTSDGEDASLATRAVKLATWDTNDARIESVGMGEASDGFGEAAEAIGGGESGDRGAERRVLVGSGRREGEVKPLNAKLDCPKCGLEDMIAPSWSRWSGGMAGGMLWNASSGEGGIAERRISQLRERNHENANISASSARNCVN